MNLRVLTIQEMLDLPFGHPVTLVDNKATPHHDIGSKMTRGHLLALSDDDESVSFSVDGAGGGYDYFEEGQVAVRESEAKTFDLSVFAPETGPPLGVFRPELETRKVGKIRVELVDEGFPLALREVAKIMTWAQTAKGYKDHDWQNLPNAEVALSAAASRHRTDHIEQRVVQGLDIDQCVDVESSLHHKAHEAFGVLAQLELMLRGKFVDKHPAYAV